MIRGMIAAIDWSTLAAITVVMSFIGGVTVIFLRAQMAQHFVTRREHDELHGRLTKAELRLAETPSKGDIEKINDRLANGQAKMDVLAAQSSANGRSLDRVEIQLDTITKVLLEREKGQ